MSEEKKIVLDKDFYDDLRSGQYVKVFVNDIMIKSKYLYSLTPGNFMKIILGRFEKKKDEDVVLNERVKITDKNVRINESIGNMINDIDKMIDE